MKVVINYQEYGDVDIEKKVLQQLKGVEILETRTREPKELIPQVRDADGLLTQYCPCDSKVIAAMEKAKVIVRYGIAVDTIDLEAAKSKNIKVCNVPYYCLDEVSNHALALILALHRKIFLGDHLLRKNQYSLQKIQPIPRMCSLNVGLVGFGHIPRTLVSKLKPLFRKILAYDPFVKKAEIKCFGAEPVSLEDLFRQSDFISIHAPSNEKTRHLVNKKLLSLMKPTAYLINTSRGALIDEQALIEALAEKRIAGAGLDVFESEPLPMDSPLRNFENVILTMHYAWYSEGAIRELKESAAKEALRVLKGQEPLYEVRMK